MARRRAAVLLVWGLLLVGLGVAAAVTGPAADAASAPPTLAQDAWDRLDERIPGVGDPTGWIVLAAPDGTTVDDPPFPKTIDTLVGGLRDLPGITAAVPPDTGGTVSADRRVAFVPVAVTADLAAETRSAVGPLVQAARAGGMLVELGGALATPAPGVGPGTAAWLAAGVLAAAVIAGLVLGSPRGALLAMGTALIGSGVGAAAAVLAGRHLGLTEAGALIALLTGLAVGGPGAVVSLGRRAGPPPQAVVGGLLVVVSTAGLAVSGIGMLTVIGVGSAITVVASILAVLTLLPALVSITGGHPQSPGEPVWRGRPVTGRPLAALGAAGAALAVIVVPAVMLVGDPSGGSPGPAQDMVAAAFGPGAAGPLLLSVEVERPDDLAAALPAVARQVRSVDGVALAAPGRVSADGTIGVVTVLPTTGPADPATRDLVYRLRELRPDHGAAVEVTGATAVGVDVGDELSNAISRYLLVIGGVELVLLIVLVRPRLVGAVAAAGSAVSVGATTLLAWAVGGWTGWGWSPGIDAMVPVVGLALLLGLVPDQAVRSAFVGPVRAGVRTVVGCAVLVAAVFGAVLAAAGAVIAGVAATVVIGVLLDAVVVRVTLVPAVLRLVGRPPVEATAPPEATPPAVRGAPPATDGATPAGTHAARGAHGAEPGRLGRQVIEQALAPPETRRGGRHRGG